MNPFIVAMGCGGFFDLIVLSLAVYVDAYLNSVLYIFGFLGIFVGSYFVAILDDDLKINKQVKQSSDTKHNTKHFKELRGKHDKSKQTSA